MNVQRTVESVSMVSASILMAVSDVSVTLGIDSHQTEPSVSVGLVSVD